MVCWFPPRLAPFLRHYYDFDNLPETDYGYFDVVIKDADPPGNSFRFTDQFYDADLDQYYLRARQYSPDLSRFTARDPYPGQFNEPATLHAYLYCLNMQLKQMWNGTERR